MNIYSQKPLIRSPRQLLHAFIPFKQHNFPEKLQSYPESESCSRSDTICLCCPFPSFHSAVCTSTRDSLGCWKRDVESRLHRTFCQRFWIPEQSSGWSVRVLKVRAGNLSFHSRNTRQKSVSQSQSRRKVRSIPTSVSTESWVSLTIWNQYAKNDVHWKARGRFGRVRSLGRLLSNKGGIGFVRKEQ